MFPLRDNIPSRFVDMVNYALMAACVIVFLVQVSEPEDAASLGGAKRGQGVECRAGQSFA